MQPSALAMAWSGTGEGNQGQCLHTIQRGASRSGTVWAAQLLSKHSTPPRLAMLCCTAKHGMLIRAMHSHQPLLT